MKLPEFKAIGIVHNLVDESDDYRKIKDQPSSIEIFDEFAEALTGIEENEFIDIVFCFHKSEQVLLSGTKYNPQTERGVFGTRSPRRPNLIGVTSVRLIERNDNILLVKGLDALNGTPVLDIKSSDTSLYAYESDSNPVHQAKMKNNPRIDIRNHIYANRTETLMIKAAQMHGHFCPGLAMGIMAAVKAMNLLEAESDGMEDLLAITETNNCFSDGVQFVTGCSFGNNALVYKDLGKTAFTLTHRDCNGIRISTRPESQQVIREAFPDFRHLYQKVVAEQNHDPQLMAEYRKSALDRAFGTLSLDFDSLFKVEKVKVEIPSYARINDSFICPVCNESVMSTRTATGENGAPTCLSCDGSEFNLLDGNGIHCNYKN
ncbi:hypothetical protein SDC9_64166 [bioreactor metagenome]|uniref:TsaA-like domain-containing protein n=1 Tax=bioreactor metagenome TaxID=1076179 RepID=A0A644XP66_9ZZZZ